MKQDIYDVETQWHEEWMEHDVQYRAIMEWIETTTKCDEEWNELTIIKINNSKLKLQDNN